MGVGHGVRGLRGRGQAWVFGSESVGVIITNNRRNSEADERRGMEEEEKGRQEERSGRE